MFIAEVKLKPEHTFKDVAAILREMADKMETGYPHQKPQLGRCDMLFSGHGYGWIVQNRWRFRTLLRLQNKLRRKCKVNG